MEGNWDHGCADGASSYFVSPKGGGGEVDYDRDEDQ